MEPSAPILSNNGLDTLAPPEQVRECKPKAQKKSKRYFKITNAEENHNGYQYVNGLNILDKPFEEEGSCVPGGLYFSDVKHILEFIDFGIYLREITLPDSDSDFKMVKDPAGSKWRANKIILGKRHDLMDVSTFEFLISLGANINKKMAYPIRWACRVGNLEFAKFLIESGTNFRVENDIPLRLACVDGHLKIIKLLIEKGADCKNDNNGAIKVACECGHLEVVKFLIENGADFKIENNTPLRLACMKGYLEIVKFLIEKGASCKDDDNYKDGDNNALILACSNGHLEIVKFLIENGADFETDNNYVLRYACTNGNLEFVKFLVGKYSNPINFMCLVPIALENKHLEIATYLELL